MTCLFSRHLSSGPPQVKVGSHLHIIVGPVILITPVCVNEKPYLLILTIGLLYLVAVATSPTHKFFPTEMPDLDVIVVAGCLPILLWNILPSSNPNDPVVLLECSSKLNGVNFIELHFPPKAKAHLVEFVYAYTLVRQTVDSLVIDLPRPEGARIVFSVSKKAVRAEVQLLDFQWSLRLKPGLNRMIDRLEHAMIKPPPKLTLPQELIHNTEQPVTLLGAFVPPVPTADTPPGSYCAKDMAELPLRGTHKYAGVRERVVYTLCILFDLVYSPDLSVVFQVLLLFKISDFGRALCLNSQKLLLFQLHHFGNFLRKFSLFDGTPFLHYAALVCPDPIMFRLICERSNLSSVDAQGRTAVFYAIRNPQLAILRVLIDANADINRCDGSRRSPLIWCLEKDHQMHAKCLLDYGAYVHRADAEKYVSALSFAIDRKSVRMLKLLLPYAGHQINCPDSNGLFPVHACLKNSFSLGIIRIGQLCPLLNPNLCAGAGRHAIHYLFETRGFEQPCNPPLLQALFSLKALDLNMPNNKGMTPLMELLSNDSIAGSHKVQIVEFFAGDPRCDLNLPGSDGMTPLYRTIMKDKIDITKILLANGAFPNQPNVNGETPIGVAIAKKNLQFIRLLLLNGANPCQWVSSRRIQLQLEILPPEIRNEIRKETKKGTR
jgi:ankyrin repeat protein